MSAYCRSAGGRSPRRHACLLDTPRTWSLVVACHEVNARGRIAWVSVRRKESIPVEPALAKIQPKVERPGDPTALAQAVVRPEGEAPRPGRPPAPLLADRRPVDPGSKPGVGRSTREERALGEALFAREWVPNDPLSHGGDGLGPVYNETSCMACHGLGAPGGAGPDSKNVALLSAAPFTSTPTVAPDQVHPGFRGARSTVLHRFGTDPEYASWRRQFYLSDPGEVLGNPAVRNEDSIEGRIYLTRRGSRATRALRPAGSRLPQAQGDLRPRADGRVRRHAPNGRRPAQTGPTEHVFNRLPT